MKTLHRPDLFGWSAFDPTRNIDFHGTAWAGPHGVVVVDPLPLTPHDRAHLDAMGPLAWIVVTNSDHVRGVEPLVRSTSAKVAGPAAERDGFPIGCDRWLMDGDEVVPGLVALALDGSKTPGELALLLEGRTLITGDLVRAHRGGGLDHVATAKLADPVAARASVARLAELEVDAVIVGDGWPVFRDGAALLRELVARW